MASEKSIKKENKKSKKMEFKKLRRTKGEISMW